MGVLVIVDVAGFIYVMGVVIGAMVGICLAIDAVPYEDHVSPRRAVLLLFKVVGIIVSSALLWPLGLLLVLYRNTWPGFKT